MVEVEVKLKIDSAEIIEKKLLAQGFSFQEAYFQEDKYFDSKDGEIRKGGQALRLRVIRAVDSLDKENPEQPSQEDRKQVQKETVCITYKGEKLDSVSMTRQELETWVADKEVMEKILGALGFHAVPPSVKKTRREFLLSHCNMHACLDDVEGLGAFLELEVMAEEKDRTTAMEKIERMLQVLGYELSDTGTNSYLSMLQGIED